MQSPQMVRTARYRIVLFVAVAAGIALRVWHIDWDLPELYEEAYPFSTAWHFWNWGGSGLDLNPHIFNYAAFSFYFQFVLQVLHFVLGWIGGLYSNLKAFHQAYGNDPSPFIIIARSGSVLFDMGTMIVTYLLGRRVFSRSIALLATVFLALNVLHVSEAHYVNVDTPLAFFTMLGCYCAFRVYSTGGRKWYIYSGLVIGLAMGTKYTGAILITILVTAHVLRSSSLPGAVKSLKSTVLMQSLGLSILLFFLLNPYIILSFVEFKQRFSLLYYNVIAHGHLGVVSSQSTIGFYLFQSLPEALGLPLVIITGLSAGMMLLRRYKRHLLLLAFPVLYLLTIAQWEYRADRYLLPVIPLFLLVGSFGLVSFSRWLARRLTDLIKKPRVSAEHVGLAVLMVVMASIIIPTGIRLLEYHDSFRLPDTRTVAKDWIIKNIPRGSGIATTEFGLNLPADRFHLVGIPYHPVMQEYLAGFYQTEWYRNLDLVVGSSFDRARYALEPLKYGEFLRFYDSLDSQCDIVQKVVPEHHQNGPAIWLYRPTPAEREGFTEGLFASLNGIIDTSIIVDFLEHLAYPLYVKGVLTKSAQLMERASSLAPGDTKILNEYAWNLFNLGRFQAALPVVERSLGIDNQQVGMTALMGSILLRLGRHQEAEGSFKRALTLDARFEMAYLELELLYRQQGDTQKRIDILMRYLKILPAGSEAAGKTLELLQSLRGRHGTSLDIK